MSHIRNSLTWGPLIHNSPISFGPNAFPLFKSMIFASVLGKRYPQDPALNALSCVLHIVGDVSVIPYPSRSLTFGAFLRKRSIKASPTGAPPT